MCARWPILANVSLKLAPFVILLSSWSANTLVWGHVAAVIGFEVRKVAIEGKIAEIRLMLDGGRSEPAIPS